MCASSGARLIVDLGSLNLENTVNDPASKSSSHNSGDPEATFDPAALPVGLPAPELRSIGPYRLISRLGEGGMGQVWLAEQSAPVKRQVALKIIKAGYYDHSSLLRFDLERQTLAIMDHPAIAKVFDAGSTSEGQPYFVMEYVPGLPITKYCDGKRLTARERLALFIKVCEGVQHAHQKAIIHRDLKPSNILVVEVDGKPMPRIIDFGIAKAISERAEDETLLTYAGGMLGTLGYMSPEQADPTVQEVDTRTDVYSLGVVLYELLTGVLPFDTNLWQTKPFHEVLRQLHEEDPTSPSTRISGDPTAKAVAENRNTDSRQLARLLRGDLDWITLKALERERTRRYGTPSELSADIHRYLRNEPVTARPASVAYRAKKYIQRHKFGVAAATGLLLLLIVFGAMQTIQLRRITRERDRADRVTQFMTGMFKVSDPSEARGNDIRAREILDKASKDIETGLANDRELQAQMMHVMGNVYESLGLYSKAESLLGRAVEIRRRILGVKNKETLKSMDDLTGVLRDESRYSDAERLCRETVDTRRQAFGREDRATLSSMTQLGSILNDEGHYPDAEKLHREALEVATRKFGPQDPLASIAMKRLAVDLAYEGKYPEAEQVFRQKLEIDRRALGSDHPEVLGDMNNLAATLQNEQRYPEAEKVGWDLLQAERRVLGPEHPDTLMSAGNLAAVLHDEKRYSEAEKLYKETFQIKLRVLGPEHRSTLVTMSDLADLYKDEGRYPEAEQLVRQSVETERRTLGPEQSDTLLAIRELGDLLKAEKRYPEAEKTYREVIAGRTRVLGPEHPRTIDAVFELACTLALEGKRDEALANLQLAADRNFTPEILKELDTTSDFESLKGNLRFEVLLAKAHQAAAAKPQ
jgi:non-specific serine/threonine protein kinase/serine/threonine-protein kinase